MPVNHLTSKQQKFIEYYMQGNTGAESVRMAGYSLNSVRDQYESLMANPKVKAEIDKKRMQLEKKTNYTLEKWQQRLIDMIEDPNSTNKDRLGALALLGKSSGYYALDNRQKANITLQPTQINIIKK